MIHLDTLYVGFISAAIKAALSYISLADVLCLINALLQQPKLLLCCCVECTKFHAAICHLLQFLTFMLLACISCNTLMFVQHLL